VENLGLSLRKAIASCEFDQSLLSPHLFFICFLKTKKGEREIAVVLFFGCFVFMAFFLL
jgi:hypothetical protein